MTDEDVIYGWYAHHETWAVVGAEHARSLADAVLRAQTAKTVDEMRSIYADIGDGLLPGNEDDWLADVEDDAGEVAGSTPFSWEDLPGVADGDWPPMPSRLTLDLPQEVLNDLRKLSGVTQEDTVLNGDYLVIPSSAEDELVLVLRRHGLRPHRDDATIHVLSGGDALYA